MINSRRVFLLIGLAGLLLTPHGFCREPSNIVGTDIYPDEITGTYKKNTGKETFVLLPFSLPTKALNLAYAAECFYTCLQPLYNFSELVRLEKIVLAGAGEVKGPDRHNFYKEIVNKEALLYEECNPLALLVRCLFNQVSGTSNIDNFRVSKNCLVVDSDKSLTDYEKTIEAWAQFIATTLKLYEQHSIHETDKKSLEQAVDLMARFTLKSNFLLFKRPLETLQTNIDKKPTMARLLADSITYSQKNGLGKDFPLRILMAAVYTLFGHEKKLISDFYKALQRNIATAFSPTGRSTLNISEELTDTINTKTDHYLAASADTTPDENRSKQAYALLKQYFGEFTSVAYETITIDESSFADCFETMLRNIVIIFLQTPDKSLQKGLVRADVDAFFENHPSNKQYNQKSHDDWGIIVSKIPGAHYRRGGKELVPSMPNMLFMLNYLFDLRIPAFTRDFAEYAIATDNTDLVASMLPLVNEALMAKLSLPDAEQVITINEHSDFSTRTGSKIYSTIKGRFATLKISIRYKEHGEADVVKKGKRARLRASSEEFPFLARAIGEEIGEEANVFSNLALLVNNITREKVYSLLEICRGNQLLIRMLYNIAAKYYIEENQNEFYYWLCDEQAVNAWPAEAFVLAKNGLYSLDYSYKACYLAGILIKQGLFYEEAHKRIDKAFDDTACRLLLHLIENDDTRPATIEKATRLAVENATSRPSDCVYILIGLINKDIAQNEASAVAKKLIKEESIEGFWLLEELVRKGHRDSISQASHLADIATPYSTYELQKAFARLCAALAESGNLPTKIPEGWYMEFLPGKEKDTMPDYSSSSDSGSDSDDSDSDDSDSDDSD